MMSPARDGGARVPSGSKGNLKANVSIFQLNTEHFRLPRPPGGASPSHHLAGSSGSSKSRRRNPLEFHSQDNAPCVFSPSGGGLQPPFGYSPDPHNIMGMAVCEERSLPVPTDASMSSREAFDPILLRYFPSDFSATLYVAS